MPESSATVRRGPERTRRRFIQGVGAVGLAGTAGCLEQLGFAEQSARVPPLVENRPAAVYHPTHVEAMQMVGTERTGPYAVAVSYSFPHRFWRVTGDNRTKVTITQDDSMHLMVSVWDAETGVSVPTATVGVTLKRDGDVVDERTPWTMLSQRMGVHFGDNVALPETGTYDVSVEVEPIATRATGRFQEAFTATRNVSFSLDFEPETVRSLEFTEFPEKAGSRAAVSPMEMAPAQTSQLPEAAALPGEAIGEGHSGDGVFVVRGMDSPPAGIDAPGPYLAVSPRTPYNRYPLALMSLSARLARDGDAVFDGELQPTIDPAMGYHLGATVDSLQAGDDLTVRVDAPPQLSRHEGYETAFFDMEPMTVRV